MQFFPSLEHVADIFTKPFIDQDFFLLRYKILAVEHVSIIFLLATNFEGGGGLFPLGFPSLPHFCSVCMHL
jgi:hypothetical protein